MAYILFTCQSNVQLSVKTKTCLLLVIGLKLHCTILLIQNDKYYAEAQTCVHIFALFALHPVMMVKVVEMRVSSC